MRAHTASCQLANRSTMNASARSASTASATDVVPSSEGSATNSLPAEYRPSGSTSRAHRFPLDQVRPDQRRDGQRVVQIGPALLLVPRIAVDLIGDGTMKRRAHGPDARRVLGPDAHLRGDVQRHHLDRRAGCQHDVCGLRVAAKVVFRPGQVQRPRAAHAPPMIIRPASARRTRGSSRNASATLVSGPIATRVISPGRAMTIRTMSSAARPPSGSLASSSGANSPCPSCPSQYTGTRPSSGFSAPIAIGIPAAPRSASSFITIRARRSVSP